MDTNLTDSTGNLLFLTLPLPKAGHTGNIEVYVGYSRVMLGDRMHKDGQGRIRGGIIEPAASRKMSDLDKTVRCRRQNSSKKYLGLLFPISPMVVEVCM